MVGDYRFFIVLDGLFLLDWRPDGLNILISATPMHKHSVANDIIMDPATRPEIPAARDYVVTGLKSGGAANPFPSDFDVTHLSLTKTNVSIGVENATNPHALITVDVLPDAIFGDNRFAVDSLLLLNGADPSILKSPQRRVVFCERTILAYKDGGYVTLKSSLASNGLGASFPAVRLADGRQMLALFSRPLTTHMGFHGTEINALLTLKSSDQHPKLMLTGINPNAATPMVQDPEVAQLGLPVPPTPPAGPSIMTVDGTGCGIVSGSGG